MGILGGGGGGGGGANLARWGLKQKPNLTPCGRFWVGRNVCVKLGMTVCQRNTYVDTRTFVLIRTSE